MRHHEHHAMLGGDSTVEEIYFAVVSYNVLRQTLQRRAEMSIAK